MNKKITAAEFYDSVERELSGLKPDSGLIQHVQGWELLLLC